jgi:hypothetical protein
MNFPNYLLLDAEMAKARLRETWEPDPAGSGFDVQSSSLSFGLRLLSRGNL